MQDADGEDAEEWLEGVAVGQKTGPSNAPSVQAVDVKFDPAPQYGWEERREDDDNETQECILECIYMYMDKRSIRLAA